MKVFTENVPLPASGFVLQWASLFARKNKAVHLTDGLAASNIDEKYYEPPLMQVIPSACAACPPNKYIVSNMCRGCVAHPCMQACPKGAISMKDGKSYIDQDKCIKCGKCKAACPYDAISHNIRPCEQACGVKAIGSDEQGRASILEDKCVSCGMCMVSCPFGAISDKSQISSWLMHFVVVKNSLPSSLRLISASSVMM